MHPETSAIQAFQLLGINEGTHFIEKLTNEW